MCSLLIDHQSLTPKTPRPGPSLGKREEGMWSIAITTLSKLYERAQRQSDGPWIRKETLKSPLFNKVPVCKPRIYWAWFLDEGLFQTIRRHILLTAFFAVIYVMYTWSVDSLWRYRIGTRRRIGCCKPIFSEGW